MSTSSSLSSTSKMGSKVFTSMKPSARLLSNRASPSTVMPAPSGHSCFASKPTSKPSSTPVARHRWLIQHAETGQYLGLILDGKPTWVNHPLDGMTHASMEIASHNLHKLREFYKLSHVRLEPIMFYAYPERPTQWFTDYDG